jgi:alpha-glucosidase
MLGPVAVLLTGSCLTGAGPAPEERTVASPDGKVQIKILLGGPRLRFAVDARGRPVIEPSPIGINVDGVDLTEGVEAGEPEPYRVKETYPWRGVHSRAVDDSRGAKIPLTHAGSRTPYTLDVRVADDGVALRLIIPGAQRPRVPDESTAFLIPAGSTVWSHNLRGHYEGQHEKRDVADVPAGSWAAPPLTFKLPDGAGYASITEAALVNYSGMALQADGRRGFAVGLAHRQPVSYPYELRYTKEDIERLSKPASVSGTITTPWRVVMIGADLNALVNCDMVHNLCPPPDPDLFPEGMATAWVKPGRAVWEYLDGRKSTLEEMKEYCRMAGELGFQYNVLEGFWRRWGDDQVRELVEYGRGRNVGIWLWSHTRELHDPDARRRFFERCRALGVVGVKLDFFDHEAKEVVDLYQAILKETAGHRLLVNFHGSNKPTGEARTWPNELTREAVRGMENRSLKPRSQHDTTLPFTRFLAGHADYTPVLFGDRRGDTTWAHQVATAAVFTSPLLTFAVSPRNLLANPAVEVIKSIPAVWDETVVLPPSEIGEVAAFARRNGGTWFLAVLNGPSARTLTTPLSFLGPGDYRAVLVRDHEGDPAALGIETTTRARGDSLTIRLSDGGGFVARFTKE